MLGSDRTLGFSALLLCALSAAACKREASAEAARSATPSARAAPPSAPVVDHGELDTKAPVDAPRLASTVIAATVYKLPDKGFTAARLRAAGRFDRAIPIRYAARAARAISPRIPMCYVCTDDSSPPRPRAGRLPSPTRSPPDLRARSSARQPRTELSKRSVQVRFRARDRAAVPRIPTRAEQEKSEFKLANTFSGSPSPRRSTDGDSRRNDVALDARRHRAVPGLSCPRLRVSRSRRRTSDSARASRTEAIPFWLGGGSRKIPNVPASRAG